jgi:uncharacterized protein (TIGR00369 family)
MIQPRIAASFGRQAMMRTLGATLLHASDGVCRISAPVGEEVTQQHGYAHAGFTFALGDSAAGYAALSSMPDGAEVLTVEMKINLLAPATGTVTAEGRVVRAGRRLVVATAEVRSGAALVALLQGTMLRA